MRACELSVVGEGRGQAGQQPEAGKLARMHAHQFNKVVKDALGSRARAIAAGKKGQRADAEAFFTDPLIGGFHDLGRSGGP